MTWESWCKAGSVSEYSHTNIMSLFGWHIFWKWFQIFYSVREVHCLMQAVELCRHRSSCHRDFRSWALNWLFKRIRYRGQFVSGTLTFQLSCWNFWHASMFSKGIAFTVPLGAFTLNACREQIFSQDTRNMYSLDLIQVGVSKQERSL